MPGGEVDVRILGETRRAVVIADSPYDPANASLRAERGSPSRVAHSGCRTGGAPAISSV